MKCDKFDTEVLRDPTKLHMYHIDNLDNKVALDTFDPSIRIIDFEISDVCTKYLCIYTNGLKIEYNLGYAFCYEINRILQQLYCYKSGVDNSVFQFQLSAVFQSSDHK